MLGIKRYQFCLILHMNLSIAYFFLFLCLPFVWIASSYHCHFSFGSFTFFLSIFKALNVFKIVSLWVWSIIPTLNPQILLFKGLCFMDIIWLFDVQQEFLSPSKYFPDNKGWEDKTHISQTPLKSGIWCELDCTNEMYSCKIWKIKVWWKPFSSAVFVGKHVWRDTNICDLTLNSSVWFWLPDCESWWGSSGRWWWIHRGDSHIKVAAPQTSPWASSFWSHFNSWPCLTSQAFQACLLTPVHRRIAGGFFSDLPILLFRPHLPTPPISWSSKSYNKFPVL